MGTELERLLGRYEAGAISRRELLGSLAMLLLPVSVPAGISPEISVARQLNHVTLFVPNVERSQAFYQNLFGMPLLTRQPPGVNLSAGGSFLGLYPINQGEPARVDHFCIGLEHFDAEVAREKLSARGIDATIRLREDTKELYFTDPRRATRAAPGCAIPWGRWPDW